MTIESVPIEFAPPSPRKCHCCYNPYTTTSMAGPFFPLGKKTSEDQHIPKLLGCLHVVCSSCLYDRVTILDANDQEVSVSIDCPRCEDTTLLRLKKKCKSKEVNKYDVVSKLRTIDVESFDLTAMLMVDATNCSHVKESANHDLHEKLALVTEQQQMNYSHLNVIESTVDSQHRAVEEWYQKASETLESLHKEMLKDIFLLEDYVDPMKEDIDKLETLRCKIETTERAIDELYCMIPQKMSDEMMVGQITACLSDINESIQTTVDSSRELEHDIKSMDLPWLKLAEASEIMSYLYLSDPYTSVSNIFQQSNSTMMANEPSSSPSKRLSSSSISSHMETYSHMIFIASELSVMIAYMMSQSIMNRSMLIIIFAVVGLIDDFFRKYAEDYHKTIKIYRHYLDFVIIDCLSYAGDRALYYTMPIMSNMVMSVIVFLIMIETPLESSAATSHRSPPKRRASIDDVNIISYHDEPSSSSSSYDDEPASSSMMDVPQVSVEWMIRSPTPKRSTPNTARSNHSFFRELNMSSSSSSSPHTMMMNNSSSHPLSVKDKRISFFSNQTSYPSALSMLSRDDDTSPSMTSSSNTSFAQHLPSSTLASSHNIIEKSSDDHYNKSGYRYNASFGSCGNTSFNQYGHYIGNTSKLSSDSMMNDIELENKLNDSLSNIGLLNLSSQSRLTFSLHHHDNDDDNISDVTNEDDISQVDKKSSHKSLYNLTNHHNEVNQSIFGMMNNVIGSVIGSSSTAALSHESSTIPSRTSTLHHENYKSSTSATLHHENYKSSIASSSEYVQATLPSSYPRSSMNLHLNIKSPSNNHQDSLSPSKTARTWSSTPESTSTSSPVLTYYQRWMKNQLTPRYPGLLSSRVAPKTPLFTSDSTLSPFASNEMLSPSFASRPFTFSPTASIVQHIYPIDEEHDDLSLSDDEHEDDNHEDNDVKEDVVVHNDNDLVGKVESVIDDNTSFIAQENVLYEVSMELQPATTIINDDHHDEEEIHIDQDMNGEDHYNASFASPRYEEHEVELEQVYPNEEEEENDHKFYDREEVISKWKTSSDDIASSSSNNLLMIDSNAIIPQVTNKNHVSSPISTERANYLSSLHQQPIVAKSPPRSFIPYTPSHTTSSSSSSTMKISDNHIQPTALLVVEEPLTISIDDDGDDNHDDNRVPSPANSINSMTYSINNSTSDVSTTTSSHSRRGSRDGTQQHHRHHHNLSKSSPTRSSVSSLSPERRSLTPESDSFPSPSRDAPSLSIYDSLYYDEEKKYPRFSPATMKYMIKREEEKAYGRQITSFDGNTSDSSVDTVSLPFNRSNLLRQGRSSSFSRSRSAYESSNDGDDSDIADDRSYSQPIGPGNMVRSVSVNSSPTKPLYNSYVKPPSASFSSNSSVDSSYVAGSLRRSTSSSNMKNSPTKVPLR